jgi:hypothetical protein
MSIIGPDNSLNIKKVHLLESKLNKSITRSLMSAYLRV